MKLKYIIKTVSSILATVFVTGCNAWTDMESINNTNLDESSKTEEYYAALRKWKETPGLPQVFVWFDNWTGTSPTGENSLRGLPDSVTIASNWGGHPKFDLSPDRKADMEYVQKVKGTKVVVTLFSSKVGDDMPKIELYETVGLSTDPEVIRPGIKAYAEAIYDHVVACGYDGFDWDYEPTVSGQTTAQAPLWRIPAQRTIFIEELSFWFGKGSQRKERGDRKAAKPGLLFLVDGEVGIGDGMDREWLSYYIDYYVLQAYGGGNLTGRVQGVIKDMQHWIDQDLITAEEVVGRTILTENFESFASSGGGFFRMADYFHVKGDLNQQIGGCGIYRVGFDYNQGKGDYDGSPEYYYLRQGITKLYHNFYKRLNASPEETEKVTQ